MANNTSQIDLYLNTKPAERSLREFGDDAGVAGKRSARNFDKQFSSRMKTSLSNVRGSILAIGATFATLAVTAGLRSAIDTAKQFENAMIGLRSVAAATGTDMGALGIEVKKLAADGLIPLSEITASLKNLLAKGFTAEQALSTFKSLRNAASFNRQGQLDLGVAVQRATEGLKNELSTLVDNAGITKNLSIIYKEFAASIGTTVAKLSEAERVQALYTGIQKEASIFQGDYNKLLGTFSGASSKASGAITIFAAAIGEIITKNPTIIFFLNKFAEGIKNVADSISTSPKERIAEIGAEITKLTKNMELARKQLVQNKDSTFFNSYFGAKKDREKEVASAISQIAKLKKELDGLSDSGQATKTAAEIAASRAKEIAEQKLKEQRTLAQRLSAAGIVTFKELRLAEAAEVKVVNDAFKAGEIETELEHKQQLLAVEREYQKKRLAISGDADKKKIKAGFDVNKAFGNIVASGTQTFVKSLLSGGNAADAFKGFVLNTFGDLATQLGAFYVAQGIASLKLLTLDPTGTIAAGVGLIALGQILKSFAGSAGGAGASSSGGGSGVSSSFESASFSPTTDLAEEVQEQAPQVTVNIAGDILDSDESGSRIIDLINAAVDGQGVTLRRNAIA